MPVMRCQKGGKGGYKFGPSGVCFTGAGARAKAAEVGRAISASKSGKTK